MLNEHGRRLIQARFGGRVVRKLQDCDELAILQHFLRLDNTTRRMRFGNEVDDAFLKDYAALFQQIGTVAYGAFVNDKLRAIGELRQISDSRPMAAEAAFSVEQNWQDKGIGNALLSRILSAVQDRGIERLHMICLPENVRMQRLVAKQMAVLHSDALEIETSPALQTPSLTRSTPTQNRFINATLHC